MPFVFIQPNSCDLLYVLNNVIITTTLLYVLINPCFVFDHECSSRLNYFIYFF